MTPRGDCPESLRRTALSWALSPPPGRSDKHHDLVVWCNFSDVFRNRAEFERLVSRRRFFRRRLTSEDSL